MADKSLPSDLGLIVGLALSEDVGDGDITPHLKYAQNIGLNETNFSIEGEKPLEDIAFEMQRSNCLVLNSYFETQGCVILEAFSCGLPVISTNVGGIKEILNSDRGILAIHTP